MCPSTSTYQPVELVEGIDRDLAGRQLTAASDHLLTGVPNTVVYELDVLEAIRPPEEAELLDGKEDKPSSRLPRLEMCVGR